VGTDVEVAELCIGSLGVAGTIAEAYIEMIRTNATHIAEALS
jgi:hypothetical protein